MASLNVFFDSHLVGKLTEDQLGVGFQYSEDWLRNPRKFAISWSLPLSNQFYLAEGENFFANLLPEGIVRESLCQKLGVSSENDIALLERIGHECAGALVVTADEKPKFRKQNKRQISEKEFAELLNNSATVYSGIQGDGDFPFSLAGAQDKIPVIYEDGHFFRPTDSLASTHILKFAQDRFKYVPENELICSLILESYGLPVPSSRLVKLGSMYHLLVKRYDRDAFSRKRFHQEDFCQALAVSHKKKYEKEGGPLFQQVFAKLESVSINTTQDLDFLIRWQILNTLLGNCDGHVKNLSLLMNEKCEWSLAPFYDVVMTMIYPKVSNKLALSIGGQNEIGNLHRKHWTHFFQSLSVRPLWYLKQIHEMIEEMPVIFESVRQYFELEYGATPVLELMEKQLHENMRRVLLGLRG